MPTSASTSNPIMIASTADAPVLARNHAVEAPECQAHESMQAVRRTAAGSLNVATRQLRTTRNAVDTTSSKTSTARPRVSDSQPTRYLLMKNCPSGGIAVSSAVGRG